MDSVPNARRSVGEETAQVIDREVKGIVEAAHQQALRTMRNNRDLREPITLQLLEIGPTLHQRPGQVQALPVGAEPVLGGV
ncbi:hypothetical protein [Nodosilinea nodulosa]|uniref:hypothetical protein n=1 Tax=Nodosilinea nodulosa TaxID=416001 RepID=UPI000306385D